MEIIIIIYAEKEGFAQKNIGITFLLLLLCLVALRLSMDTRNTPECPARDLINLQGDRTMTGRARLAVTTTKLPCTLLLRRVKARERGEG